jgi:hypothetical protein
VKKAKSAQRSQFGTGPKFRRKGIFKADALISFFAFISSRETEFPPPPHKATGAGLNSQSR